MGRIVDLSHVVEDGTVTYPGLPPAKIGTFLSHEESCGHYAPGTCFHIGCVDIVANTGTYLDAPFHRFPGGRDVSDLPLDQMVDVDGVVVRIPKGKRAIGPDALESADFVGKAVLFATGWDRKWGSSAYWEGHPYVASETTRLLVNGGAKLVGIDSLNIDDTEGGERPVHTALLRAGIPVVEHLTRLDRLPGNGFSFNAAPLPFRGLGSSPVRAWARVPGD